LTFRLRSAAATGDVFGDVPANAFAEAWIKDLSALQIAAGCHVHPSLSCPTAATTRGQSAALLVSAFGLHGVVLRASLR